MIESFLGWVGGTGWSIRLLESLYMWNWVELVHVLSIALFVGTAIMMDLRLVGLAFKGVPASEFTGRMLPWTRVGFFISVATGLVIFYSNPLRYWHNVFFRVKLVMLVLAGLNVWFFHSRIHKRVSEWDVEPVPPRAAKVAGVVSILAWAMVVVTGRMIAYNWFDCDLQPQPDWVNWLASCALETGAN